MAIQTFTTGQVLTAAQVNALNSNDFNQTVSAKTASYTLVAADKGTRITMSSTSATTVTVNTSLFAAGDTLFIQNLDTGVSTITAGTATVDTSASLALAQHEGGTLYFTSAGESTFFKSAGAAAASGGMTLLSTTTLSGASTTISAINQTFVDLYIRVDSMQSASTGSIRIAPNGTSTAALMTGSSFDRSTVTGRGLNFTFVTQGTSDLKANDTQNGFHLYINGYSTNATKKSALWYGTFLNPSDVWHAVSYGGHISDGSQISSLVFTNSGGNLTGGTVFVFGVK